MIALVVAAMVSGALSGWVFSHASDPLKVRATLRQIHGHFLEFRLFFDEPALIWRAQKELFAANARLVGLLLPPALLLALPMAWLLMQLSDRYSVRPLKIGAPAVVTVQFSTDLNAADTDNSLIAPRGIVVETEALRAVNERQMVWRIRPQRPANGDLRFTVRGVTMTKTVTAGESYWFLSPRREQRLLAFLMHPEEPRLPAGNVLWLEVEYPRQAPWWLVCFFTISSASALLFIRWF
jgi:hypothetical protein